MFGSPPTGNGEPEQGRGSWKVNDGVEWPGGPMRRQRQQDQAVSVAPIGGKTKFKKA